ncbi:MAG TPA: DUF952 domain-containing protein [Polyangiaceae bacterium]|nr:DUF952 domain-containing protein [Polyangiaceae bacterium]
MSNEGGKPEFVFHITERSTFNAALETGVYEAPSLKAEGFIHCSKREQIERTASRFFRGKSGLVLLCIDAEKLGAALRFEPADGELFPHCYVGIAVEGIVAVIEFPCDGNGEFGVPEEVALLR